MACQRPNLQNLPRDPAYRACFRAPEGRTLVKADYSQVELGIAAEMASDTQMKQVFMDGEDLHVLTAISINGKQNTDDVTADERQLAKAVNFGLIYGMGAPRLASYAKSSFGVDLDESTARGVRRQYFKTYRGIRMWHKLQGKQAETRTVIGRLRTFDGDGYFSERLNSPVQGTGADGLKLASVKLWETRDGLDAFPVLTIHDEIVIEAPIDRANEAKEWLVKCMTDGMAEVLTEVPVVVDAEVKEAW